MTNTALVSIIIPVATDVEGLSATLASLAREVPPRTDVEIIVCNDGGDPAISQIVAAHDLLEARLEGNQGSYAARNAGIRMAQGRILVFVDADQRIGANWLSSGLEAIEDADYVGGQIVVELPDHYSIWHEYDRLTAFPVHRYLEQTGFAPTANLFVRRDVFDQVGNFHSGLRSGGDREFGERVRDAGYRQMYCPGAITYHPSRGRAALVAKRRRTGSGMADVRLKAWKQRRWLIVTYGLAKLLLVPIETMANSHLFQERMWKLPQLIAIDMQLRAIYHAAFVRASLFGHRP